MSHSDPVDLNVLVISASSERRSNIIKSLTSVEYGSVKDCTYSDIDQDLIEGVYDLVIVDWVDSDSDAERLIHSIKGKTVAILSLVTRDSNDGLRALDAGSDSVVYYPEDLSDVHLACLLAVRERDLRKALENKAAELVNLKQFNSALTRTILHDLKNPLTVTYGNLQVVESSAKLELPPILMRFLSNAISGCRKQLNIMDNLSDIFRLEDNRMMPFLVPFSPNKAIKDEVDEYSDLDPDKEYCFKQPESSTQLKGDAQLFKRVVHNILDHVMHYTRNGGHIQVSIDVDQKEKLGVINFDDDGEPIPPEFAESIFDRFSQVAGSHGGGRWDNGMNLAFSRQAIRGMEGEIKVVDSDVLGVRIQITLPLASVDSETNHK